MPRITCRCGTSFSISRDSTPQAFRVTWNMEVQERTEAIDEALERGEPVKELLWSHYMSQDRELQAYECQACGRWMMQRRASDADVVLWLRPEPNPDGSEPERMVDLLDIPDLE